MQGYDYYLDMAGRHLSETRLHHSRCVAEMAKLLAEIYGQDEQTAMVAAALHDICKEWPREKQLQYLQDNDILLDINFLSLPKTWHAYCAYLWVKENLGIDNEDILNAIKYHTTGRAKMSRIEEIVYLADLTSADRRYYDAQLLRTIQKDDINQAMLFGLRFSINNLTVQMLPIVKDTWEAYNYYVFLENRKQR